MSNVLPFPQTPKALKLYHTSMGAAGFLALLLCDRSGEPIPENVQRFDEPNGTTFPEQSPALLLALLLWGEIPKARRKRIESTLRGLIYCEKPNPAAVQLHNLLSRRR